MYKSTVSSSAITKGRHEPSTSDGAIKTRATMPNVAFISIRRRLASSTVQTIHIIGEEWKSKNTHSDCRGPRDSVTALLFQKQEENNSRHERERKRCPEIYFDSHIQPTFNFQLFSLPLSHSTFISDVYKKKIPTTPSR